MSIKFQADTDLNEDILFGVVRREPRIDFQMAEEANLRGLSDEKVFAFAAQENRILFTRPPHNAISLRRVY